MKRRTGALLPTLEGAGDATPTPLHRQVYSRIRSSILAGTFAPGARLPSTRTLAADLGMSRITVESAFTQLTAEGFLVRRVGAGSYVAAALPEVVRPVRRPQQRTGSAPPARRTRGPGALSARGRAITDAALAPEPRGRASIPAVHARARLRSRRRRGRVCSRVVRAEGTSCSHTARQRATGRCARRWRPTSARRVGCSATGVRW